MVSDHAQNVTCAWTEGKTTAVLIHVSQQQLACDEFTFLGGNDGLIWKGPLSSSSNCQIYPASFDVCLQLIISIIDPSIFSTTTHQLSTYYFTQPCTTTAYRAKLQYVGKQAAWRTSEPFAGFVAPRLL